MKTIRLTLATLGIVLFGGALILAQMSGGMGQMQPQAAGTQTMSGGMMSSQQQMSSAGMRMTGADSQMRNLTTMNASMKAGAGHDQMISSMQGVLDQMHKMHGELGTMMKDPAFGHDKDMMDSFEQASRNLDQMATAFQSMAKSMTKVMKGVANGPKK